MKKGFNVPPARSTLNSVLYLIHILPYPHTSLKPDPQSNVIFLWCEGTKQFLACVDKFLNVTLARSTLYSILANWNFPFPSDVFEARFQLYCSFSVVWGDERVPCLSYKFFVVLHAPSTLLLLPLPCPSDVFKARSPLYCSFSVVWGDERVPCLSYKLCCCSTRPLYTIIAPSSLPFRRL